MLTRSDEGYAGPGAAFLIAAAEQSQFVLIGESHGNVETPELTTWLARAVRPAGAQTGGLEAVPKVLFKFGSVHTERGYNAMYQLDLGNTAAELAALQLSDRDGRQRLRHGQRRQAARRRGRRLPVDAGPSRVPRREVRTRSRRVPPPASRSRGTASSS